MKDVVSTFPLICLPTNAILKTFRTMTHTEIFGISILSKKTKNLVESLKVTTTKLQISFSDYFKVEMIFPNNFSFDLWFLFNRENQPLQELETPGKFHTQYENKRITWKNVMSINELLNHFQYIFHSSTTTISFWQFCEKLSFESIHRSVRKAERIRLFSNNREYTRRILSIFQADALEMTGGAYVHESFPRDILIQNFDSFHSPGMQFILDDLLMTNARSVMESTVKLSSKLLNKFLKLWVKGSNPRLEWVFVRVPTVVFQTEELLKGLGCKNAPLDTVRLFKSYGVEEPKEVTGGWDIWRLDGTKGTITLHRRNPVVFQMFVWHDHCRVTDFDS